MIRKLDSYDLNEGEKYLCLHDEFPDSWSGIWITLEGVVFDEHVGKASPDDDDEVHYKTVYDEPLYCFKVDDNIKDFYLEEINDAVLFSILNAEDYSDIPDNIKFHFELSQDINIINHYLKGNS
jgi:hypothetical protein